MFRTEPTQNDRYKVTKLSDVADFFGVSVATVNYWRQSGAPGEKRAYHLDELAKWLRNRDLLGTEKSAKHPDPLLVSDGDSPALERYRLARAQISELELEERKGVLVSRERVLGILRKWSEILRRVHEQLREQWGTEAAEIHADAIDQCDSIIESELVAIGPPRADPGEPEP